MRTLRWQLACCVFASVGLVSSCGPSKATSPDANIPVADADGDGISDSDEGASQNIDTDGDGVPDFQDADSDGDGINDVDEAGDADGHTAPVDSDSDGVANFRDTDSDGNGRPDMRDGTNDADGDGVRDFADLDDDGDAIPDVAELGNNPSDPLDTDNDGTPDFRDTDSDGDSVPDLAESFSDFDNDGLPNYLDPDADDDCRGDGIEAGNPLRDTDQDGRPDFLDRDADDDGLLDRDEDVNCNGVVDGGEASPVAGDTDGDGVSDMVEVAAGTNPTDGASNPAANGDFVFVVPFEKPQVPVESSLDFKTKLNDVDVYVIVDRSGSMAAETTSIKTNMASVISGLQCPPLGTGDPATCIPNLYAGLGGIGYRNVEPYRNYLDIAAQPNFAGAAVTNVTGSPTTEPTAFSLWSAITGQGTAGATGCSFGATVAPRTNCPGGTFGYPCFREGALPVVVVATDEPPLSAGDTYHCPNWTNTIKAAFNTRSARVMGIYGSGSSTSTIDDLKLMATDTGAIDAANANAPLVFNGADANAANAISSGIRTLVNGVPLDMAALAADDPADSVDAISSFVDRLETLQIGNAQCSNGLTDIDSNADSFKDQYVDVRAGVPVCWKLVAKQNTTVRPKTEPQLFRARVNVIADGVTTLDTRDVFFLVPPAPADGPID